jgi:cysteine synthase
MAKIRKANLHWISGDIKKEMNKRYKLLKRCDGTEKTSATWDEYNKSRYKVARMLRKAESTYWHNQFQNAKNTRDFWNIVNKIQNKSYNKHNIISPCSTPLQTLLLPILRKLN